MFTEPSFFMNPNDENVSFVMSVLTTCLEYVIIVSILSYIWSFFFSASILECIHLNWLLVRFPSSWQELKKIKWIRDLWTRWTQSKLITIETKKLKSFSEQFGGMWVRLCVRYVWGLTLTGATVEEFASSWGFGYERCIMRATADFHLSKTD